MFKELRLEVGCTVVGWFPRKKPSLVLKEILSTLPVSFTPSWSRAVSLLLASTGMMGPGSRSNGQGFLESLMKLGM